jgi:hypothetical protein
MSTSDERAEDAGATGSRRVVAAVATAAVVAVIGLMGGLGHASFGLTSASAAEYEYAPFRIPFFPCVNGGGTTVPADTPLYLRSGWASGTGGLVVSSLRKLETTIDVERPPGVHTTYPVVYGPVERFGSSWASFFRVDFASLRPGETMTIRWTFVLSAPQVDIALPDGGPGLSYFDRLEPGFYDVGTCTVTAT